MIDKSLWRTARSAGCASILSADFAAAHPDRSCPNHTHLPIWSRQQRVRCETFFLRCVRMNRRSIRSSPPAMRWLPNTVTTFGRRLKRSRLHLTLLYLDKFSDIPETYLQHAIETGDAIAASPFDLTLDMAGSFRSNDLPWWLSCSNIPIALTAVHRDLYASMRSRGETVRGGASFTPHVTISRSNREPLPDTPITSIHWRVGRYASSKASSASAISTSSKHGSWMEMNKLLAADEPAPFSLAREESRSPFVLICDHAGRRIPRALGDLGVSAADRERHIAWDIGAAGVASHLPNGSVRFSSSRRIRAWSSTATGRSMSQVPSSRAAS